MATTRSDVARWPILWAARLHESHSSRWRRTRSRCASLRVPRAYPLTWSSTQTHSGRVLRVSTWAVSQAWLSAARARLVRAAAPLAESPSRRATSEVRRPSTSIIQSTDRHRWGSVSNAFATTACSAMAELKPSSATCASRLIQWSSRSSSAGSSWPRVAVLTARFLMVVRRYWPKA